MKLTGIVIEYNPLHHGHIHHIKQSRQLTQPDALIGVMSPHFVQRGEMAILDKWTRTEAALQHGVDLVIELPTLYALQAAQEFANGAVALLHKAQMNHLVFGSESNDLKTILEIADLPINANHLRESMKTGVSYPKAISLFAGSYHPNDILAIAYAKAAKNKNIQLHSVLRSGGYLDETLTQEFVSATAIRKAMHAADDVSMHTPMDDLDGDYPSWDKAYGLLRYKLLSTPKEQLQAIFLISEGIENHLIKMATQHDTFDNFVSHAITKRYSKSRILRTCAHILLHTTKTFAQEYPKDIPMRVLGFNQKGRKVLQHYKAQGIQAITRFNQIPKIARAYELQATTIYSLQLQPDKAKALIQREVGSPVIIKSP
ncbi:MAG: nucleotidyltransferase family protein [Erysipelothrix sp.]|jgi:predicted nucleotidyltransferase|nr:nucleotidyltransferase family protein [Erysipelothrix sp.]